MHGIWLMVLSMNGILIYIYAFCIVYPWVCTTETVNGFMVYIDGILLMVYDKGEWNIDGRLTEYHSGGSSHSPRKWLVTGVSELPLINGIAHFSRGQIGSPGWFFLPLTRTVGWYSINISLIPYCIYLYIYACGYIAIYLSIHLSILI